MLISYAYRGCFEAKVVRVVLSGERQRANGLYRSRLFPLGNYPLKVGIFSVLLVQEVGTYAEIHNRRLQP
jgi:hypothetical protein